jgi:ferredoxin
MHLMCTLRRLGSANGGQPFTAELSLCKKIIELDSEHSLLEALQKAGFDIDSSC